MHTPGAEETLSTLGQDFINAFHEAVYGAQDDYDELRGFQPSWAATYTQRFKANFFHERIWARILPYVEEDGSLEAVDQEPSRVINIGTQYSLRIKRHSEKDLISTYRTPGAVDYYGRTIPIDSMERVGLAIGYRWDSTIDQVLAPVISMQDLEKRKTVWSVELIAEEDKQSTNVTHRVIDAPQAQLELRDEFLNEIKRGQAGEERG